MTSEQLPNLGPNYRLDEDGELEKVCVRCRRLYGEQDAWWPATREFFTRDADNGPGQLHSWCNACSAENRLEVAARRQEARERQLRLVIV